MFDLERDDESACALRQELRSLVTPAVSPDFDSRVLERLARREPLRNQVRKFVIGLRPAFGAAIITAPVVLALISWLGQAPMQPLVPRTTAMEAAQALPSDRALDSPDLSPATLRRLSREEAAARGRSGDITHKTHAA